jgi:ubiquitin C-terminal hydrolase
VQEFCQVLFESIETSIESSSQRGLISDLYESLLTDSIQCLKCGYESSKETKIYNYNLAVKDPFNNISNGSIEKGLAHYLKKEQLVGDNQYACP